MLDAPMPKVIMFCAMNCVSVRPSCSMMPENALRRKYQIDRSQSPSPTTISPMTLPAEKAARSPLLRLLPQAVAVRAFAAVAIFMPKKPESPENAPPVRKAKGMNGDTNPTSARMPKTTNIHPKKTDTTRYCLFKKAFAPLRMTAAMPDSFSPSGIFSTFLAVKSAKRSAAAAAHGATSIAYCIVSPFKKPKTRKNHSAAAFFT